MRWGLIVVVALYLIANALIWNFAVPGTRLTQAADGSSWYRPALALMTHGDFVDLENPALIDTYRPPLYPLFAAAAMKIAGGPSPAAIAIAQILLLLLAGLLFRDIVRDWMPGWEDFGLALLLLNPNVLSSAQFVQSEILFLAFTTLAFWAATKYLSDRGAWRFALLTGISFALACLARPTAQFLLFVPLFLFALLDLIARRKSLARASLQGLASFAIAMVVIAPWVHLVATQGHGYALSDSSGKYRYVWDQIVMVEAQSAGLSYHEAGSRLTNPGGAHYDFIAGKGDAWERMSVPERNKALTNEGMAVLLSYPAMDFAKALYRSQAQFFLAGGAGNWHNLFGIGAESLSLAWFTSAQDDLWTLLDRLFGNVPPAGLVFSVIAIGFTVATRVVGLIGVFAFADRKRLGLLLIVAGFILYFAFIHVFVGNSRYRIAIEPMLMLLTIGGLEQLSRIFPRR